MTPWIRVCKRLRVCLDQFLVFSSSFFSFFFRFFHNRFVLFLFTFVIVCLSLEYIILSVALLLFFFCPSISWHIGIRVFSICCVDKSRSLIRVSIKDLQDLASDMPLSISWPVV